MGEQYIKIQLPGCTIFLTASEMLQLLQKDLELWEKVLKRGKAFKRTRIQRQREQQRADLFQQKQEVALLENLDQWGE